MWVRSEFGVLCNLDQATDVAIANGTVEAHFGKEVVPLAHRAKEEDALKIFDRISQDLSDEKHFLDLSKHSGDHLGPHSGEAPSSEAIISAEPGAHDKAL